MTVKGGTTPACAACKYQRRKCIPSCLLAPYFPASQPKMFQNVHRLFGVSNVTKTLQNIESKDVKDDAMRSIIYEAEMRSRFPVHGCYGIMIRLQQEICFAYRELQYVCAKIDACREQIMTGGDASICRSGRSSGGGAGTSRVLEFRSTPYVNEYDLDSFSDELLNRGYDLSLIQTQMDLLGIEESDINAVGDFSSESYVEHKMQIRR